MTPREIIAEAWALTLREKRLRRWGFLSSFFETLLNIKLIGYQLYFLHAYLVGREVGFFDDALYLYNALPLWLFLTILITFLLLLAVEFIMPNLAKGAIIGLAAKSHKGEKVEGGFVLALYNFFPILAIHESLLLSSWSICITLGSLSLRYMAGDIKYTTVAIIVFFFLFSNILKFFFSFAEPAVVVQKAGVFESMGISLKFILSYMGQVLFLMLLLFFISIRIMINALIMLVLPLLIFGLGFVLALFLVPVVAYVITGIVGIGLVIAASNLFAYMHVFNETVWTISFIELRKRKDLDVIG